MRGRGVSPQALSRSLSHDRSNSTGSNQSNGAIEDENVTADLVYSPKLIGIYGKPTLMRHNKLVYNQELRDKLWSYTVNELNLDI